MKKNKLKRISSMISFGGLLFLSNISLISIGFSAWSIVGAASAEAQIQVSAADVIDLNQYFTFVDSPTIFECTSEGIANDHVVNTTSKTQEGYIQIPFRINVGNGKISDHIAEGSTGFTLGTTLVDKNAGLDFFSVASVSEVKLACNDSNSFAESDYSFNPLSINASNKELNSSFDLTSFSYLDRSQVYFVARYKVTFTASAYKSAYSSVGGNFKFSFKVGGIFDHA